jgi:hypothetical protein
MIYFIQDSSVGHIKIGFTEGTAENRMKALQTGSPVGLEILCTSEGGREEEKALHLRFQSSWVHGEWFKPTSDIIRHIGECLAIKHLKSTELIMRRRTAGDELPDYEVVCQTCKSNKLEHVKTEITPTHEIRVVLFCRNGCGNSNFALMIQPHRGTVRCQVGWPDGLRKTVALKFCRLCESELNDVEEKHGQGLCFDCNSRLACRDAADADTEEV